MRTLICDCSLLNRCIYHGAMMRTIHAKWNGPGTTDLMYEIYARQDGYGEPGFVPEQGMDWSGIRDSSPDAIENMYQFVLDN
jgi:hypothetical protein